jgi:S1-C subfamily serine protease
MSRRRKLVQVTVVLALTAVAGCAGPLAPPAPVSTTPTTSTGTPPQPSGTAQSLPDVVERLSPSVVTVRTAGGIGSGVVYRPDVVVTNQHVLQSSGQVTLDFADGTSATGEVLAVDPTTDLAVIRSSRGGLPVPVYRTALPRPGEAVLTIGSPLGFENTVTSGIVSATNRQIPGSAAGERALVDLIQVDAAISPGNSGGALLDTAGQVIGVNEAYIPPSAGAVSLGFAIPAGTVVDVADQLLARGSAAHPYLGVSLGRLTPQLRQALGIDADAGALVLGLEPGGPADRAGVRVGDVVVSLAGKPVNTVEDLLGGLRRTTPGAQVPITVQRAAARQDLTVTIGSRT